MYIPNDDKMYSLYWEDAKSLLVYEHMKEAPIMHANIPIINPDQATSLLRRLLTNVSFSWSQITYVPIALIHWQFLIEV